MFTAALEEIFKRAEMDGGINVNGMKLNNLRFADDIILFATSEDQLQETMKNLNDEGKKDGMIMNKKKTKIMCNKTAKKSARSGISVNNEVLEEVNEYQYLGRLMTSENEIGAEVDKRIKIGWQKFGQYSNFMKDKKMPICLKRKVLNTVIIPAMTYGAETWSLTKKQEEKLAVAQRSMERSILNITRKDHIRNEEVRQRTGATDILGKINTMKGQWAGHLARMDNKRWAKIATEWTPREGKRRKGRPKKRWRDSIEERCGITWMQIAKDRSVWRRLWRLPACSGMKG